MKKAYWVGVLALMIGWCGCSTEKFGQASGIGVVFDGAPLIIDPTVRHMGAPAGRILTTQWKNGVTLVTIALDNGGQDWVRSNMAAVVKSGGLNLVALSAVGEPLAPQSYILGFNNNFSLQLFKLKNLIQNINMAAARRAMWLSALGGLTV